MLDAANFFRLLGLVLGWWLWGRLRGSRELTARGSRVTPGSLRLLGEEVEVEEGPWEPGFIVTPSSSFCEVSELFEVFKELEVLPATRFWDRVRFRSAKVPAGKSSESGSFFSCTGRSCSINIELSSIPLL